MALRDRERGEHRSREPHGRRVARSEARTRSKSEPHPAMLLRKGRSQDIKMRDPVLRPSPQGHLHLKAGDRSTRRPQGNRPQGRARRRLESPDGSNGSSPEGKPWTADMLAEKGSRKVAIEIEWPRQSIDAQWRRQRRYEQSGVKGVWLFCQPGFPISANLPAACVGGGVDEEGGLQILVPGLINERPQGHRCRARWNQVMSPGEFFRGLFEGRFLFGLPAGLSVPLLQQVGPGRARGQTDIPGRGREGLPEAPQFRKAKPSRSLSSRELRTFVKLYQPKSGLGVQTGGLG